MHFKNETCLQIQVTEHDTYFQAITSNNDHKNRLRFPTEDSFYDNLKCPQEGLRDLRLRLLPLLFQHFQIYKYSQIKDMKKRPAGMSFLYTLLLAIKTKIVTFRLSCYGQRHILFPFSLYQLILFFFPSETLLCSSKKKTCILIVLRAHKCSPCQLFHIILVLALS